MSAVFVSHRIADEVPAEKLAAELRAAGHDVWLDTWEIGLGDSIVAKMNDGLSCSAYVVLCYSSAGTTSPWISREWMSALARQLDGAAVKILPVQLTGGDPPAVLADLKYADLTTDWAGGLRALLAAIR
ncbi:toll/interleukin-1 receptor domain-containing protein [Lentzea albidocapillata]|uniref:TIR domain-containing protein n=1 Tax=Lentzea albidocapillata TaxID=40571 RepID=A0A1W2FS43_9PSEU|nr:toll/interleukin-1 receptor domain-containing protein [Lentzea albidocapillata]SMD24594.1 TIR domain-containing protein [Lentzea albidocapillata]